MPAFIENPRRAPRAPVRCETRVAQRQGGFFTGPTTDYGPRGCQLATPARLAPGERVFLELVHEKVEGSSRLSGRVAWSSTGAPWRCGVAFDDGAVRTAASFFERLSAAHPGLDATARAPDRIPEDAPLAPASPPRVEALLTADEVRVLTAVGAGLVAAALRDALGARWDVAVNAFFSLLGRGYLVVGPPDAEAARAWRPLLARAGGADRASS